MAERSIKVRLKTDLTQYGAGLLPGTEGYTAGRQGMYSRGSDRFITVRFPTSTLDVLWDSLEIIDEDFLREMDAEKRRFDESLKSARDVILHLGPRGGFRCLSLVYTDVESGTHCHLSEGFRDKAYQMMETLKSYGIPVREVREP